MGRVGTGWEKFKIGDLCKILNINTSLSTEFGDIEIFLRCGKSGNNVLLKLRSVPPELIKQTFDK